LKKSAAEFGHRSQAIKPSLAEDATAAAANVETIQATSHTEATTTEATETETAETLQATSQTQTPEAQTAAIAAELAAANADKATLQASLTAQISLVAAQAAELTQLRAWKSAASPNLQEAADATPPRAG
jgi:hypothetical protein